MAQTAPGLGRFRGEQFFGRAPAEFLEEVREMVGEAMEDAASKVLDALLKEDIAKSKEKEIVLVRPRPWPICNGHLPTCAQISLL